MSNDTERESAKVTRKPPEHVLIAGDFLSESELGELDRLRHTAEHYGMNMTPSALARLNLLSVMEQRDYFFTQWEASR